MKTYVVGFAFDTLIRHVLLIKKNRPEWQRGKFNGVGGKVEKGEHAVSAIVREFREEAGLFVDHGRWKYVACLYNSHIPREVGFFSVVLTEQELRSVQLPGPTDEELVWVNLFRLWEYPTIPNLRWLIPLALDNTGIAKPVFLYDHGEY